MYQHSGMLSQSAATSDIRVKQAFTSAIQKKMNQDKLSISVLAKRMKTGRTAVRRILDVNNTSITFRSMSRIARAVGLEVRLIAEPMSPEDLDHLAQRLAKTRSRTGAAKLADKITEGFYAGS